MPCRWHALGGPPRVATWNWRAATESGLNWPGWSRVCWCRATEPVGRPGACPGVTALRAPQQPCQRWRRGLVRTPQADGAGPRLPRLQSPSPLTAPRCSRAVALLSANGVRRPGGAPAAPRRQSLHSGALPRRGPAPVRPRPRPRSGPRRGSSPVTPRCAPRAARGQADRLRCLAGERRQILEAGIESGTGDPGRPAIEPIAPSRAAGGPGANWSCPACSPASRRPSTRYPPWTSCRWCDYHHHHQIRAVEDVRTGRSEPAPPRPPRNDQPLAIASATFSVLPIIDSLTDSCSRGQGLPAPICSHALEVSISAQSWHPATPKSPLGTF